MIIATGIAHADFAAGRLDALNVLLPSVPLPIVFHSQTKVHASVWAPRMYRGLLDVSGPDDGWYIMLNDDVTIASRRAFEALFANLPEDCESISLATIQKEASTTTDRFLASYCCTGPGYAMRRATLRALVDFYAKLPKGMQTRMNEDEVLAHFAWSRQRPFWQCIPALVKHDTKIPSTLGFDNHPMRVASVLWEDRPDLDLESWPVPPTGPAYCPHPWLGEGRMRTVHRVLTNGWQFDDSCAFCAERDTLVISPKTGVGICGQCVADAVGHVLINARVA